VATGEFDLLDMVVLLCFIRPIQALFAEGQEHGRTIPLADLHGSGRVARRDGRLSQRTCMLESPAESANNRRETIFSASHFSAHGLAAEPIC
jgi:hypothetical protein